MEEGSVEDLNGGYHLVMYSGNSHNLDQGLIIHTVPTMWMA
jgi:hypothetical protein